MKRYLIAFAVMVLSLPAVAVDYDDFVPYRYILNWNDEFDGLSLGADWTHEVQSSGWVNNELQNYVNGSYNGQRVTEVSDGTLKITARKIDGKIYSGRLYAKVSQGWKYGYFEARIKLPKGRGTWPAFWMMPCNNNFSTNPWPHCGEIDIMEEVGYSPGNVSATVHCTKYNNGNTSIEHGTKYVSTAESDFHIYGCEWTENVLNFYVDGDLILSYKNDGEGKDSWPFDVPFYPILNLAWGGSWGGAQGVDESALPATMEVDYMRVYKMRGTNLSFGGKKLDYEGNSTFSQVLDLVQGRTYLAYGDTALTSDNWYYDTDFFVRESDGKYTFRGVSGKYRLTADFNDFAFKLQALDDEAATLTYNTADGSGAIWVIGANSSIGKRYFVQGNDGGWSVDRALCMAQTSQGIYKMTLTVGEQLNKDRVNFKFFHQAGWGGEFTSNGTSKITTDSKVFGIGTGTNGYDNGNIFLRAGNTLNNGDSYRFTIDATTPANVKLSVEKVDLINAIEKIPYRTSDEDDVYYTIEGLRVNAPLRPGIYIHSGKKIVVK